MRKNPYDINIIRQTIDTEIGFTFEKDIKYYCSKCKFYKGECMLKRVIRICRKKRLRNVPIQESERG